MQEFLPDLLKNGNSFLPIINLSRKLSLPIYAQSKNDLERISKLTNVNVDYLGNLKLTKRNTSFTKLRKNKKNKYNDC